MTVRQSLIHHTAACHDCGARCDARNAQAWATNHVRRHPAHFVEVSLGYAVSDRPVNAKPHPVPGYRP